MAWRGIGEDQASDSSTNINSYSKLDSTYMHSQCDARTNEAKEFFSASFLFQLSEIEVYEKL